MEAGLKRIFYMGSVLALGFIGAIARVQAQTPRPAVAPVTPQSSLIDINSASRDDLMALDGIGEVRAEAIIRARPFKAKTDLVERRLIPEAVYEKIADKVWAKAPPPPLRPTPTPAPPKRT
jgi:DNA uptake protein ComE-like DNA-binding protein